MLAKRPQVGPSRDEVHLGSGLGEPPAEVTADAAGPVNSYTHIPPRSPTLRPLHAG